MLIVQFAYVKNILLSLLSMGKTNRGRVITYDQVPDDALETILEIQSHLRAKKQIGKISMSAAITKIIRTYKTLTNGKEDKQVK